jgi:hypothetical protein
MKNLITTAALLITFFSINFDFKAAILTAVTNNGSWSDATAWDAGRIPSCGDTMIIPAGLTLFITDNVNLNTGDPLCPLVRISVAGRLRFNAGKKLTLAPGGCMTIEQGGSVLPSAKGGGSSEGIRIGNTDGWIASDGPLSGLVQLGCGVLLPVNLISFDTELALNKLSVFWEVASENEIIEYQIETSVDGKNWTFLATQRAANSGAKFYSITEEFTAQDELVYVRLKSLNQNGTVDQLALNSVNIDFTTKNELQVFPNPVSTNADFIVLAKNNLGKNAELVIYNQMGKVISSQQIKNEQANNKVTIDNQNILPGSYILTIVDEQQKITTKFIVI